MGWLDKAAKQVKAKSLRELAYTMEKATKWPKGKALSADTVANRLRDLDKGENVDWWFGTGKAYLPVLADVLSEDQDQLEELIRLKTGQAGGQDVWIFDVFPALKPLNLQDEDPFPGIPKELLSYGGPKEPVTYWYAPKGAGKTLLGRWLSLRYGWSYVSGATWSEIELPKTAKVFVELESVKDIPWRDLRDGLVQRILIASPEQRSTSNDSNTRTLEAQAGNLLRDVVGPPQGWREELVEWTAARLPSGEDFDSAEVLALVQEFDTSFDSPGDLLEFLGAVTEIGVNVFRQGHTQRIINTWMKAVVARHVKKCPVGVDEVLGKQGYEILCEMETTRLVKGLPGLLPLEQWTELIPETLAPTIERERLLGIVQSDDEENEASKLEKIRIALGPDAAAIANGLTVIGVLGREGLRGIGPLWVRSYVLWDAFEKLFNAGPNGLAALLLHNETSEVAMDELLEVLKSRNFEIVKRCIEGPFETPESLAALDGAFRAVGLARLNGVDVSDDFAREVWEAQSAQVHFAPREGFPLPWFKLTEAKTNAALTTRHAWIAAALSLGFTLTEEQRARCPEQIDPFKRHKDVWKWLTPMDVQLDASQDQLQTFLYSLGGEFYARMGTIFVDDGLLRIEGPDVLVAYLAGCEAKLPQIEVAKLLEFPFGWSVFEDACRRQAEDLDEMINRCWETWGEGGLHWPPFDHRVLGVDGCERIWRNARAEHLSPNFLRVLGSTKIDWKWLDESVWRAWLEDRKTRHAIDEGLEVFEVMPKHLAIEAFKNGWIGSHDKLTHDLLWSRFPEPLLKLLHELATTDLDSDGNPTIVDILYSVPDELVEGIVDAAEHWLAKPNDFPGVAPHVLRWLGSVVDWRRSGWRRAFELVRREGAGSGMIPR